MRAVGIILLFITTATFSYPAVSLAQNEATNLSEEETGVIRTPPREEAIITRRPGRVGIFEQRGATRPGRLGERRAERRKAIIGRIIAHAHRMLNRAKRVLGRLDHILGRVESRMKKFEKAGKDVSSLTPLVEDAKAKGKQAEAAIEKAKEMLTPVEKTDEPREAVHAFVAQMREAKKALREYRAAIVKIIKTLRGISGRERPTVAATGAAETGE